MAYVSGIIRRKTRKRGIADFFCKLSEIKEKIIIFKREEKNMKRKNKRTLALFLTGALLAGVLPVGLGTGPESRAAEQPAHSQNHSGNGTGIK